MNSLRYNLDSYNYPESKKSAPTNVDGTTEAKSWKHNPVSQPYIKGLAPKIQKIRNPYDHYHYLLFNGT